MAPPGKARPRVLTDVLRETPAAELWARLNSRGDLSPALLVAAAASAVYLVLASRDRENLDYFVRLADAFLHGRVYLLEAPSWLSELIPRNGVWYVAYPPMPAVMLMPFVALFGVEFPQQVASGLYGGISVGLAFLLLGRFSLDLRRRLLLTAVFGFGTAFFFVAKTGSTWYLSHVVAVMFMLAAAILALDRTRPFAVGILLGMATIARLPVGLTAPFFAAMLLGLGVPPRLPADRRSAVAVLLRFAGGLAVPLAAYALYNVARWGTPLDPGYWLIPGVLDEPYYAKGVLSLEYIPRHLYAIFLRSWNFTDQAPWFKPSWWGLGLFLTTPLFLWLARARPTNPRVAYALFGSALALVPIVLHGNVGFSQFGYRFSLDFQPLLFIALATVFEAAMSWRAVLAAASSIAICSYGVWAISIGFVSF